ncbi:MAG: serine/threonine-protein kinase [Gaiellaceae bacterium]
MDPRASWKFREGDEIAPGRHAVRLLGGGRRYEAYLAWDEDLHTLVAVKILRPDLLDDEAARAAVSSEAQALASLDHPVIVRSFDAVLDGDRPHLVLEFLDGPRLSTLLRRYGIVIEQLLPLALQVCSALHYMARRSIVHLDVKPRNIIMSAPPRLVDLSVARRFEDVAAIRAPVGTDAYMAPEQCDPKRFAQIGPPADVWGLGATLYEALAASAPFPARPGDAAEVADRFPQLVREPAPLPRTVPEPIAELVLACLAQRPDARPAAAELAAGLEPLAASLPRTRLGLFRPGGRRRRSEFGTD